jgi:hypothetical protein
VSEGPAACQQWFEHFTPDDVALLARLAGRAGLDPPALRTRPDALAAVLAHPLAVAAVLGDGDPGGEGDPGRALAAVSPFLLFAVVVHRGWADLQRAQHVDEWVGPRQRLPVLGGGDLRDFLADGSRRLFLAELLASYTRVASGVTWVPSRHGWRRRRFSELDPVRLASLLEVVPEEEHPGIYRRLGDLALFLTGVFPDHTELRGLGPLDAGRLVRLSGLAASEPEVTGTVGLLELLGSRWYRRAARAARGPLAGSMQVVVEVAERFGAARRSLNYLADRHLTGRRDDFFAA